MNSSMKELYPLIKEALDNDKVCKINVFGTSMEPFLFNGDNVTLKRVSKYKKNDVILYIRKNGQFVLHRINKVKKDYFVLLGDNQSRREFPIYEDQIVAKVIEYEKKGKVHHLKGFKYHLYLFFWNFIFLRRVILKIKRTFKKHA